MPAYSAKQGTAQASEINGKYKKGADKPQKPEGRKHLTKQEEAEYRAQDKCFNCRQPGHMARNCAKGKLASSSNPGKPPGLKSYSVKVDL